VIEGLGILRLQTEGKEKRRIPCSIAGEREKRKRENSWWCPLSWSSGKGKELTFAGYKRAGVFHFWEEKKTGGRSGKKPVRAVPVHRCGRSGKAGRGAFFLSRGEKKKGSSRSPGLAGWQRNVTYGGFRDVGGEFHPERGEKGKRRYCASVMGGLQKGHQDSLRRPGRGKGGGGLPPATGEEGAGILAVRTNGV